MIKLRQVLDGKFHSILFFALILSFSLSGYSHAITRTVTNLNDAGAGSLRDTIENVAMTGDDIVFADAIAGGTIVLTTGLILINTKSLTITGPTDNPITIDGNLNSRIFALTGDILVVLSNLIIQNGFATGNMVVNGGAIVASGFPFASIEINDCTFRNNTVQCTGTSCVARGGAIDAVNGLTVRRSTFDGNRAICSTNEQVCIARAGAIALGGAAPLVMENSTVCNNEVSCSGSGCALAAGAIDLDVGALSSLNNDSFSDNTISCTSDTCVEIGSTILSDSNLEVSNTIINNNIGIFTPNCEGGGTFIDAGNNLQFPGVACGGTIPTADAQLGPLADNGGNTQTKAITTLSPAYNAGNNATCEATDQRGVPRPQAQSCDIGAFELIVQERAVPTLSEWGLITMAAILGIVGFMVIRRRQLAA